MGFVSGMWTVMGFLEGMVTEGSDYVEAIENLSRQLE